MLRAMKASTAANNLGLPIGALWFYRKDGYLMLEFMRNKLVSVAQKDEDTLIVHAVLDDSIYGLEIDLEVGLEDLTCRSIEGRWKRWTTPDCPRALDFLQQAKGLSLKSGVEDTIHKTIGRTSCRHYANLMVECVYALQEASYIIKGRDAGDKTSSSDQKETKLSKGKKDLGKKPEVEIKNNTPFIKPVSQGSKKDPEGGFVVDLHMHTFPASKCASSSVDDMIQEAIRIGLDAVCLTDHNYLWSPDEVNNLMEKHGLLIFSGNEIVTDQGDVLVFGFREDIQGVIKLAELKKMVDEVGGFISAAHPFRGFLTFGTSEIGLTLKRQWRGICFPMFMPWKP